VNGAGDRFDADFVKEGDATMTLTGSVIIDGAGRGLNGRVTGTQAIITLDRQSHKPIGYEFLGKPATTTIRSTKVGGL
jgi:hypothetical protein